MKNKKKKRISRIVKNDIYHCFTELCILDFFWFCIVMNVLPMKQPPPAPLHLFFLTYVYILVYFIVL